MSWLLTLDPKNIAVVVGLIISIPTAIAVIHGKLLKPIWNFLNKVYSCLVRVESYMGILDEIAYEFKPNGGASFKDALSRLEFHMITTDVKIKTIMNYHEIPAWEADKAGMWKWASDSLCDLMNITLQDASGYGWTSGIFEEDRKKVRTEWEAAIADQRNFYLVFRIGTHQDPIKVIGRANIVKDLNGKFQGYVGTLQPLEETEQYARYTDNTNSVSELD